MASLSFGMNHHDLSIALSTLEALAELCRTQAGPVPSAQLEAAKGVVSTQGLIRQLLQLLIFESCNAALVSPGRVGAQQHT
jgi:hypothetical protein